MDVLAEATASLEYYDKQRRSARTRYVISEVLLLLLSAAVPVTGFVFPANAIPAASIGAALVVLAGLRTIFQWHENWRRFSMARVAVTSEIRLYKTRTAPYDREKTRNGNLIEKLNQIEAAETGEWRTLPGPQKQKS